LMALVAMCVPMTHGFCNSRATTAAWPVMPPSSVTNARALRIFYEDDGRTLAVAKKYFPLPDDVLQEALAGLRRLAPYALTFTKEEVRGALRTRGLSSNKYAAYFSGAMR
jgi:hypothetical protein